MQFDRFILGPCVFLVLGLCLSIGFYNGGIWSHKDSIGILERHVMI